MPKSIFIKPYITKYFLIRLSILAYRKTKTVNFYMFKFIDLFFSLILFFNTKPTAICNQEYYSR